MEGIRLYIIVYYDFLVMQERMFHFVFCTTVGFISTYLSDTFNVLATLSALVLFDLVTGLWASRKNKIPITSRRLTHSVNKWVAYIIAIIATFISQKSLEIEFNLFYFVAGYIYGCELVSLFENLAVISSNKVFLKIIEVIRGKSEDIKESLLQDMKRK